MTSNQSTLQRATDLRNRNLLRGMQADETCLSTILHAEHAPPQISYNQEDYPFGNENATEFFLHPDRFDVNANKLYEPDDDNFGGDHFAENGLESDPDVQDWQDKPRLSVKLEDELREHTSYNLLQQITEEAENSFAELPEDSNTAIYFGSSHTVSDFAEAFSRVVAVHKIEEQGATAILSLIQKFFPTTNLPCSKSKFGNTVNRTKEYIRKKNNMIPFDVCKNSCCVYVGDYSHLESCPICYFPRFTSCSRPTCKGRNLISCKHGQTSRVAQQTLYYRPIISRIFDLLNTQGFLTALRYKFVKSADPNCRFADLRDGVHPQEHERVMHARFVAFQAEPENNDTKYIEISLLLSMFYDGAQIYKSKVSKFWPLYYSILNLPPLYRNKAGVGTFMLSLYTGNAGANVEKFLLQKCFVDEMTTLHNGVKYVVGDQHYYIQARTIQYCYDTKALGKELNVQEAGSLAGCPLCVSGKGTRRDTLEKVCYYSDLRNILPMNHILRYSGSSRACCPPNYYTMKESLLAVEIATGAADVHCLQHEYYKIMSQNRGVLAKVPRYLDPSCGPCDNHMPVSWFQDHAPVLSNPKSYVWFHTAPYSFSDFKDVLWYEHCDLRNCIPSARKTMAAFVELGNKAVEQKKPVDGVKGAWFASVLPASDVERDVCFDPFHCLKLVVSWLIGLIKGIKPAGLHKLVKYGAMTNTHYPHLNNGFTTVRVEPPNPTDFVGSKRKIPVQDTTTNSVVEQANPVSTPLPWAVPESVQDIIDAKVNAILVPLTYSNAFQVQSPFKQTGMLRGNAMISLFTVLIDFINLSLTTVPKAYKSFFSMVGTDLRDLMAPQFSEQQLELLERRIQETICLHMGIFPEFESRFAMHELLHISSHIKTMGPVAGWWTFSGERMIAFCKGFVQKGGRSADKAFIKRYDACERARMHMSYNFKEEEATPFEVRQNDLLHSQNVVYTELVPEVQERRDGVVHDPQLFLLFRPDKGKDYVRLNSYELTCLLDSMVAEVYKQCATDDEACQKSPFYRLYCAYRVLYERTFVQTTFGDFLTLLGEYYDGFNVIPENKHVDPRVFKEQIVGPPYMSSLCELAASGIILEQDLPTAVAAAQVGVQKNIYLNAYAFGVRFSARGKDFRETQQPELSYRQTDTDHLNMSVATIAQYRSIQSINTKWSNVRQYSSWCRFRSKNSSFGDHVGPDCYGQINYFFRIKLPEDSVLHGVPFASVVPRKFETEQKVHKIWADPWASYFEAPQLFTSMTSMYASPILVAPYDVKLLPIVPVKKNVVAANAQLVSESKTTVHFFYMIDLQPSYSKSLHYCADMNEHYNRFESILN